MSAGDLNLTGVRSVDQVLARTANGRAAVELARSLGLWSSEVHAAPQSRPSFPANLSELTPPQLSDLNARWTGEYGRIVELGGAIDAQLSIIKLQLKHSQSTTRARILRGQTADSKPLTQGALNDMAEEDPAVVELQHQVELLTVLSTQVQAAREATDRYLATISREISFRDAQMKARIY